MPTSAEPSVNARPDGNSLSNPNLASIALSDIGSVIEAGVKDFTKAPVVSIAIAAVYTIGGWLLAALLWVFNLPFLVYPVAMGFALVAPFVAVAFYDVSRSLSKGEEPSIWQAWCAVCDAKNRDIRWMALITSFAFFLWMDMAAMITLSFFGAAALDMGELLKQIGTTGSGAVFLVVGHAVGAAIALLIFSISVISIPMLFDRDIDIISAIRTSVRLVKANPVALTLWCGTIAASIVVSIATGLVLLPVVLPVLGYASWHLYKKAVAAPQ
ncbi:MAG: DUF2189 domain-containing protein [Hyphomicrobiaceae bacterium]